MRIIPQLDTTYVLVEGDPIKIDYDTNNEVIKLEFNSEGHLFIIKKGSYIIYNERFIHRVGYIQAITNKRLWKIKSHRPNITYFTLGPMLHDTNYTLKASLGVGTILTNIYKSLDFDKYQESDNIYMLIRNNQKMSNYQLQIDVNSKPSLLNHPLFLKLIPADDFHDIYVMKVKHEYYDIYNKVINGKYSELPDFYKKEILNWVDNSRKNIWISRFEKNKELRKALELQIGVEIDPDAELLQPPGIDEIFTNDKRMFNPLKNLPKKEQVIFKTDEDV